MYRGTTPTIAIKLNTDIKLESLKQIWVTFDNGGGKVITKTIDDVVIDKAYMFNGKLHIYGQNFTKWSKVYVNDEKVTTTYESGQVLTIDADSIEDGDKIVVNQVGSSSTIFRSSNEITFVDPNKEAEDEDVVTEDDSTQPTNEKNE